MSDPAAGQPSAASTPTDLARVRVALSAVVVVILVALTGLLAAPAASASSLVGARNSVAAFDHPGGQVVGVHEQKLPGESRQRAPGYDQIVVGSCVGAETEGLSGAALARQLGREGEAAIPGAGNTTRIPLPGGGYRIPDILDPAQGVIGEVKNVQSLSYTSQLRDYVAYAQQNGLQFDLYVRGSTTLSGPLQDAINAGDVNLFRSLP